MPRGVYKRTKPVWNKGLTKETSEIIANAEIKKEQTCLEKYGNSNVLQSQKVLDKISDDRHSGKLAEKAAETKQIRYNDSHYNNMDKNKATKKANYGDENYNNMEKMYDTKRKNHTFNTSKPEEDKYKELVDKYGEDDVIRQYSDERYPFKCDFYIKSLDLFIEINAHQSHGNHPYNPNNPEDIALVNFWISKQNKDCKYKNQRNQYWAYVNTFTVTDPLKLKYAKDNHLNYLMIYNNLEIKI